MRNIGKAFGLILGYSVAQSKFIYKPFHYLLRSSWFSPFVIGLLPEIKVAYCMLFCTHVIDMS